MRKNTKIYKRIEKGMYVRTTYGIGKIVEVGISYTDDNYVWMVDLITDNPNICIGIVPDSLIKSNNKKLWEYLNKRNKFYFDKVMSGNYTFVCYKPYFRGNYNPKTFIPRGGCELFDDHKFIDIQDELPKILQVGDFIDNHCISKIIEPIIFTNNGWFINFDDVLDFVSGIMTKEQFKNHQYIVGGFDE